MTRLARHPRRPSLALALVAAAILVLTGTRAWAHPHPGPHEHELDAEELDAALPSEEAEAVAIEHEDLEPSGDSAQSLTATQLLAETGAEARWEPAPRMRVMSSEGVDDPFPDTPPRERPRDAIILLGLGTGFAAAAAATAHYTLLPDCDDQSDLSTCVVPNRAEIGLRGGRLFGTIGFSLGGAAFGAFGGRELGRLLAQGDRLPFEKRRRIAIGLGTGTLALGVTGLVAGSAALGLGARRSLDIADSIGPTLDGTPEQLVQIEAALDEVKTARIGLMVLAASPVLVSTGIALLVQRPRESRLAVTPVAGRGEVGLSATLRF